MHDIKQVIENPATSNPERSARARLLEGWDEEKARALAGKSGIEWGEEHLAVVQALHRYFLRHGEVGSGRELGDMLADEFAEKGGRSYLRRLFPGGPVTQGMDLAGLPVPPHSEDAGFGTAR